ncbi:ALP1-like protein [Tanacetum coccineum]
MSDSSSYSNTFDLDDIHDIELVMQVINQDQQLQGESSGHTHNVINHERDVAEARMLGSIDCMHWEWINCLKAWHMQFGRGDKKYPTIMLEVVASYDLWIWHAFFRVAGANNDFSVLNHYPLFDDLLDDIASVVPYEVNEVTFEKGYYLADEIYPQWATFVKSFTVARDEKNDVFKRQQESARKAVERAFGVLQCRWHIIAQPTRAWTVNKLIRTNYACIILHNMILKNQKFAISEAGNIYICP